MNSVSIDQPKGYLYPACMVASSNKLYLSNDLELSSNIVSKFWNNSLKVFNSKFMINVTS